MNPVFHLYQLQKIDSLLYAKNTRMRSIDQILKDDIKLKQAKTIVDSVKQELDKLNKEYEVLESNIVSRRNKLQQSEASLYSGRIINPKELQDLQREIGYIKSNIADLEDSQLNLLEALEKKEEELKNSQSVLRSFESNLQKENRALLEEMNSLIFEVNRLNDERYMVVSQINSSLLTRYDLLRSKKNGIAISLVEDKTCSACGATLTPAECQSAKVNSGDLHCPSCGRILYAD